MATLSEQLSGLKARWESEKQVIDGVRVAKAELDEAHVDEERAERARSDAMLQALAAREAERRRRGG